MLNFDSNENLIIGISDKSWGNMRVFLNSKNLVTEKNRRIFFAPFHKKVIAADLIHGNRVVVADNSSAEIVKACDALITNNPNLILSITVADCLPIYFYDPIKKVVAIAHAGWRGVENEIAREVVKVFAKKYDSDSKDILAFIGPHIGACHFEVQRDVADKFLFYKNHITNKEEGTYIDLGQIVLEQLVKAGLLAENINLSSECTYCLHSKYFSFRRDNPGLDNLEVMTAYIGLR
jgi:YfiH family protein